MPEPVSFQLGKEFERAVSAIEVRMRCLEAAIRFTQTRDIQDPLKLAEKWSNWVLESQSDPEPTKFQSLGIQSPEDAS